MTKTTEEDRFEILKTENYFENTFDVFNYLVSEDPYKYADRFWYNTCKVLEETYLKNIPFNFLQISQIKETMFVENPVRVPKQLTLLNEFFENSDLMLDFLKENTIGDPSTLSIRNKETGEDVTLNKETSANSVHHAYHLFAWKSNSKVESDSIKTVLEWGGGYGNFAKMTERFLQRMPTYIIVDVPFFAALQALYLATIYGKENVNLLTNENPTVCEGKFNIVSSGNLHLLKNIKVDLFVSTWALSETKPEAVEWLHENKWLEAKHFLIAYYAKPETMFSKQTVELLEEYLKKIGASKKKIDAFEENEEHFYLLK